MKSMHLAVLHVLYLKILLDLSWLELQRCMCIVGCTARTQCQTSHYSVCCSSRYMGGSTDTLLTSLISECVLEA